MTIASDRERRYRLLFELGCICCRRLGQYSPPEMHHLVDKGNRAASGGDAATLPLCAFHHRGVFPPNMSHAEQSAMITVYGPALAHGRRLFVAHWGTERDLLAEANREIGAGTAADGDAH